MTSSQLMIFSIKFVWISNRESTYQTRGPRGGESGSQRDSGASTLNGTKKNEPKWWVMDGYGC